MISFSHLQPSLSKQRLFLLKVSIILSSCVCLFMRVSRECPRIQWLTQKSIKILMSFDSFSLWLSQKATVSNGPCFFFYDNHIIIQKFYVCLVFIWTNFSYRLSKKSHRKVMSLFLYVPFIWYLYSNYIYEKYLYSLLSNIT